MGRKRLGVSGFSIIELLVVMAIIGVMITFAVPSYNEFIANQRARTSAQTLLGSLMYARSEAIKVNGNVTVTANANGWADGWTIVSNGTQIKNQQALQGVNIAEAAGTAIVTYNGRGRIGGANAITFTVCDTGNHALKRTVEVELSGRPKVTMAGACP